MEMLRKFKVVCDVLDGSKRGFHTKTVTRTIKANTEQEAIEKIKSRIESDVLSAVATLA